MELALGGALLNAVGGSQKRKAQRKFNQGQAEITRHSAHGAMGPGQIQQVKGGLLGDLAQGGLAGAKFGQQFGGGAPKIEAPVAMNMRQPQSIYQGLQKTNADPGAGLFGDSFQRRLS